MPRPCPCASSRPGCNCPPQHHRRLTRGLPQGGRPLPRRLVGLAEGSGDSTKLTHVVAAGDTYGSIAAAYLELTEIYTEKDLTGAIAKKNPALVVGKPIEIPSPLVHPIKDANAGELTAAAIKGLYRRLRESLPTELEESLKDPKGLLNGDSGIVVHEIPGPLLDDPHVVELADRLERCLSAGP